MQAIPFDLLTTYNAAKKSNEAFLAALYRAHPECRRNSGGQ
jgi:hypothetical protein